MKIKFNFTESLFFWIVIIISLESSIRKYLIAAPIIILLKYPLLILLAIKLRLYKSKIALLLFVITLPTLFTINNLYQLPFAVYDFVGIAIVPSLSIALFIERNPLNYKLSIKLVQLICIIGLVNSLFVIMQSLLGPAHWLSQTVDQQFTQQTFGDLQKAPGLQAVNPTLFSIAGLLAFHHLYHSASVNKFKYLYQVGSIIISLSLLFNLSSRTYSFSFLLFFMIQFLGWLRFVFKHKVISSKILLAVFILPLICQILINLPFFHNTLGSEILNLSSSRTIEDFSSASPRLLTLEFIEVLKNNIPETLPLINGLGLGATVNNNPYLDTSNLPKYCIDQFGVEGEFPRLICSFGYYGYILILIRSLFGFIIALKSLNFLKREKYSLYIITAFASLLILDGLQLKANDNASGLLLISILAFSIYSKNCQTISTNI
jgi:hypothetical protein